MKNINMMKYLRLVLLIVFSFSIIAAIVVWLVCRQAQPEVASSVNSQNPGNSLNAQQGSSTKAQTNVVNGQNNNATNDDDEVSGILNINNINAIVKIQKYSMLTNGSFDSAKINKFINKNVDSFFPVTCSKVTYKAADLNYDGIDEVGMMYEVSKGNDKYLMFAALRWDNGSFVKDIDAVLKKNDYNFDSNEIVCGDIINGGNQEFVFVQNDKTSRAKIVILLTAGLSDFYTIDSPSELQFKDYDDDGILEEYTSVVADDGNRHMSWKKWDGKEFSEYDSKVEPISNADFQ